MRTWVLMVLKPEQLSLMLSACENVSGRNAGVPELLVPRHRALGR